MTRTRNKVTNFRKFGGGSRRLDSVQVRQSGSGAPVADVFCQTWFPTSSNSPHSYRICESEVNVLIDHQSFLDGILSHDRVPVDLEETITMYRLIGNVPSNIFAEGYLMFAVKSESYLVTYIAIDKDVTLSQDCISLIESMDSSYRHLASMIGLPAPPRILDQVPTTCRQPRFLAFMTPRARSILFPEEANNEIGRIGCTAFWTAASFFAMRQLGGMA